MTNSYDDSMKKVYFVDVDDRVNVLIALDLQLFEEDDRKCIGFFDTNRGRMFCGEIISSDESRFIFKTEKNNTMTFRVATVSEFNMNWRKYIEGNVPDFQSDNELHSWYNKQFLE